MNAPPLTQWHRTWDLISGVSVRTPSPSSRRGAGLVQDVRGRRERGPARPPSRGSRSLRRLRRLQHQIRRLVAPHSQNGAMERPTSQIHDGPNGRRRQACHHLRVRAVFGVAQPQLAIQVAAPRVTVVLGVIPAFHQGKNVLVPAGHSVHAQSHQLLHSLRPLCVGDQGEVTCPAALVVVVARRGGDGAPQPQAAV